MRILQAKSYTDKDIGEVIAVEVFVAILGASQLSYVEAVTSKQNEDFIAACENALHFIGGVRPAHPAGRHLLLLSEITVLN